MSVGMIKLHECSQQSTLILVTNIQKSPCLNSRYSNRSRIPDESWVSVIHVLPGLNDSLKLWIFFKLCTKMNVFWYTDPENSYFLVKSEAKNPRNSRKLNIYTNRRKSRFSNLENNSASLHRLIMLSKNCHIRNW